MTDEAKQKWQAIFADWQITIKTYSTMGALHTLAQHWVENEVIIERAATEEAEINGPKWTPDWDAGIQLVSFILSETWRGICMTKL